MTDVSVAGGGGGVIRRGLPVLIVVLSLAAGGWLAVDLAVRQAAIEGCPAYVTALERAAASPALVAALGTPLDPGFPTGTLTEGGDGAQLEVEVKVRGPRGEGALFIAASERAGAWRYRRLEVQLGPRQTVDLRQALPAPERE